VSTFSTIVGQWYVTYGAYRYYYALSSSQSPDSGSATWRDYWNAAETGKGTWKKTGNTVVFTWGASTERWTLNDGLVNTRSGSVVETGGTYNDVVAIRQDTVDPANSDILRQWANALKSGDGFVSPHICPLAVPYYAVDGYDGTPLAPEKMGGNMNQVLGLCIHTTGGNASRKDHQTVNGTVKLWNARPGKVSAHLAIAPSGTLIQIVPTNRIAYAQGEASPRYISVEIETADMKAMNAVQLITVQGLFKWVVNTFGVPKALATGFVGKNLEGAFAVDAKRAFDPITKDICSETTTDLRVAATSKGLTCHYWVSPTKPCPGSGMLRQMPDIAAG
jgi:hypothetical protein